MVMVLRIRGLPYSASADDVLNFFKGVNIKGGKKGICFPQGPNGMLKGEAFIEIESGSDVEAAMTHHNKHMGRRYIEVFTSDENEMKRAMGWLPAEPRDRREFVARLRGLPYDTDKKEIYSFFSGLDIAPNGIGLLVDHLGRCTGDAYVNFKSAEMLTRAKEKHLEKIGHRYVEIFDSSEMEANVAIQRQFEVNQGRGNNGGPMIGRGEREHFEGFNYGPPNPKYDGPLTPNAPPRYGSRSAPPRPSPYSRPPIGPPRGGYGPRPMGAREYGPPMNSRVALPEPFSLTGHAVRMRGLPYSVTHDEIANFFAPLQPTNIYIVRMPSGRTTGEADVDFGSHDEAKEAMKKDREKIGSRYVELFLDSTPMGNRSGGRMPPPNQDGCPSPRNYGPPYFGGGRYSDGAPPPDEHRGYFNPPDRFSGEYGDPYDRRDNYAGGMESWQRRAVDEDMYGPSKNGYYW